MLTKKDLEESPLFEGISYDSYLAMLNCFQARQRTFQAEEMICDFSEPGSGRTLWRRCWILSPMSWYAR